MKEGVFITNSEADYIINSKSEYHQPSVRRVVTTREVRNSGLWLLNRTEFFLNFSKINSGLNISESKNQFIIPKTLPVQYITLLLIFVILNLILSFGLKRKLLSSKSFAQYFYLSSNVSIKSNYLKIKTEILLPCTS